MYIYQIVTNFGASKLQSFPECDMINPVREKSIVMYENLVLERKNADIQALCLIRDRVFVFLGFIRQKIIIVQNVRNYGISSYFGVSVAKAQRNSFPGWYCI